VALDGVTIRTKLDEDERPKVLVEARKLIDEETAQAIEDAGSRPSGSARCSPASRSARVPHVLRPQPRHHGHGGPGGGGRDPAAQSIGEPGTQLTLRTFHIGGTAGGSPAAVRKTKVEGVIEYGDRLSSENAGVQKIVTNYEGELDPQGLSHGEATGKLSVHSASTYPLGATLMVTDGAKVARDGVLFTWDRTPTRS